MKSNSAYSPTHGPLAEVKEESISPTSSGKLRDKKTPNFSLVSSMSPPQIRLSKTNKQEAIIKLKPMQG